MLQSNMPSENHKSVDVCQGIEFGTLLHIQIEGLGTFKSSIIGIERGRFLIIKTPSIAGIGTKLYKKNHIVARYLYEGVLFDFRCTLIALINEPFQLSFLSYPESGRTINLRTCDRISCMIPCELQMSESRSKGFITDVSIGGCRVSLNVSIEDKMTQIRIGNPGYLSVQMPEIDDCVHVSAITRSISADENKMIIGFQFEKAMNQKIDIHALDKIKKSCLFLKSF